MVMILKILVIYLTLFTLVTPLTYLPDNYQPLDNMWVVEPSGTMLTQKILFAYSIGANSIADTRNGFTYQAVNTLCYDGDNPTNPAVYTPGLSGSLTLTSTNMPSLWDQGCHNNSGNGLFVPINFHSDSTTQVYLLTFKLSNPSNTDLTYRLKLQSFDPNPLLQVIHPLNTAYMTLTAETVTNYTLKFTVATTGKITYFLQDDNFASTKDTSSSGVVKFFDNSQLTSPPATSYPVKPPNMKVYIDTTSNDLYVNAIILQSVVPSATAKVKTGQTTGTADDCTDARQCSDGFSCKLTTKKCVQCDPQCLTCDTTTTTQCITCHRGSMYWKQNPLVPANCVMDFFDFSLITVNTITFTKAPPAIHWRVTLEFWAWIEDADNFKTNDYYINLQYQDFMSIIITPNDSTSLNVNCVPIEYLYPLTQTKGTAIITELNGLKAFILTDTVSGASAKWFHTRCAFNFDSAMTYINSKPETILPVPQMYTTYNNFPRFLKKFYKPTDVITFKVINNRTVAKPNYIRNVNVYREYMPQSLILKYFNVHKFTTPDKFPQLLFSIPFDDFTRSTSTQYTYNWYDYSMRLSGGRVINPENLSINSSTAILSPSKYFKRLNLLDPNSEYTDIELYNISGSLACDTTKHFVYCYDYEAVYACADTYYLDPASNTCNQNCPIGYMRHPDDNSNHKRDYCNFPCDPGNQLCPSVNQYYLDITSFSCGASFLNAYYHCISTSSQWTQTALQVSKTFNTHSITISIPGYVSYAIDVWIYPDIRFATLSANDMIFLTNNLIVKYNQDIVFAATPAQKFTSQEAITTTTWNHMLLISDYLVQSNKTSYYATFLHALYSTNTATTFTGTSQLNKIFFCNSDSSLSASCAGSWINAYYKNLRVWDLTNTSRWAILYSFQYDTTTSNELKHFFKMDLASIIGNKILDSLNSNIVGTVSTTSILATQNPDNHNMYNYESNFALEDLVPTKLFTSYVSVGKMITPTVKSCPANCSLCFSSTSPACFRCIAGYGLLGNDCKQNFSTGYYYYKNPPTNPNGSLSLNLDPYNLGAYPGVSFFFFLKLYGFTTSASFYKIIIFDDSSNFYLGYNSSAYNGSLELYYNSILQFQYQYYRESNFGHWIPISISSYREINASVFPNMVHMTVLYTSLPILDSSMRLYSFSEFTMPSTWIGLISDITIYKTFIINTWALSKWFGDYNYNTKFILATFPMKSLLPGQCLENEQIKNVAPSGVQLECNADYNPHLTSCTDQRTQYVDMPTQNGSLCDGRCSCSGTMSRCLNTEGTTNSCNWANQGCEHKDYTYNSFMLYWTNNSNAIGPTNTANKIECRTQSRTDFGRYTYGTTTNARSPTKVFNIDFWFYSQSYVGVNFSSFTITWDRHMRIQISYVNPNFIVKCTPLVDQSNPSNDPAANSLSYGTNMSWVYINCGVNTTTMTTYLTRTYTIQNEVPYTTSNTIPSLGTVSLTIEDTSTNGYGMTHFQELRLWDCYSCSTAVRNIAFATGNDYFSSVLHAYNYGNTAGLLTDAKGTLNIQMTERPNFVGYNVIRYIGSPVLCDEASHYYYEQANNRCDRIINFNRVSDFYFTIPSSRTNRYTIDLWIYVEDTSQFTAGVNFIYDRHVGITILRDYNSSGSLTAICFPQEYRDSLNGISGFSVYDLYSSALNKALDTMSSASETWQFVRCGVDLDRQVFYLNQLSEMTITPELLYGTTRNYRTFRYFSLPQYVNLYVQNAKLNFTRIFIRYLSIYREYIDQSFYAMQYLDMKLFINLKFWPIVFTIDFDQYQWGVACPNCGALYRVNDPDQNKFSLGYHTTLLSTLSSPVYNSYPTFIYLVFCGGNRKGNGANGCTALTSPTTCNAIDVLCLDNNKFFYNSGKYIDMTSLSASTACSTNTRLPDSNQGDGYCLLDCPGSNNIASCANAVADMTTGYSAKFTCVSGYTRVYYDCIDDSLIPNSALYFSNFFSWSNLIVDFPTFYPSYYLEFWFKLDPVNAPGPIKTYNYYMLAPPHILIQDPTDQLFKYANTKIDNGTYYYQISSIRTYEWNRIIIYTIKDTSSNTYSIYVYINYDFINPEVKITSLDAVTYDMSIQGIAFCNKPYQTCQVNSIVYLPTWGTAWYRNIRLWDDRITSLYLIQSFENTFSELISALYYYYKFTIDTISEDLVTETLDPSNNYMTTKFWYYSQTYDNDMRLNYSVNNFDYSALFPGFFISGISASKTSYTIAQCSASCKRCHTTASSNCYECNSGYALYGNTCYTATGFYLKTPTDDLTITTFSLLTVKTTPRNFDIKTENPMTITFYMKFFGIQYSASLLGATYYPIFYFKSTTSFFGYKATTQSFVIVIEGNEAFTRDIKDYAGIWTHFGLSVHRSTDPTVFPHMFNFMIGTVIQTPIATFMVPSTQIMFDTFTFNTQAVALFSSLRFYSNFWLGTYGHVAASATSADKDLIFEVLLNGSNNDNCLATSELNGSTIEGISLLCVADYNPYLDKTKQCSNDAKYLDLSLTTLPPCGTCLLDCSTQCFTGNIKGCTCNYREGLYWTTTQSPIVDYYCDRVANINFSYYNSVTIPNISMVSNDEMSLEFWVYIYSYQSGKFTSMDVIWDKHTRISIEYKSGNLNGICYPFTDIDNLASYTTSSTVTLAMKSWKYVRCAANRYYHTYYINTNAEATYPTPLPSFPAQTSSTLTIVDHMSSSNLNYGFSFIRELKLFSSYNFPIWDPSTIKITKSTCPFLLHYFSNDFTGNDLATVKLVDLVATTQTALSLRSDLIGYNYVIDFTNLIPCNEGYFWDTIALDCKPIANALCNVPVGNAGDCLICAEHVKYMKSDGTCTTDCKPLYYNDDYLLQCRPCDSTCYTCDGKYINSCTSCTGDLNLVPSLKICVDNCEEYKLTKQIKVANMCGPFTAEAEITNFNITLPLNPHNLTNITVRVFNETAPNYDLSWEFSESDTLEVNANRRLASQLVLNSNGPFTGPTNNYTVSVDPLFFSESYQYVFWLSIIRNNQGEMTIVKVKFILTMNDYPLVGSMTTLPSLGYINSTTFLFACNNCTDDNTAKENLRYKFTVYPQGLTTANETLIQDYSSDSETLLMFSSMPPNTVNKGKYYITCYCKDQMDALNSTTSSIDLYTIPVDSGVNISISDQLVNADFTSANLTEEQAYKRSSLLRSLGLDYYRPAATQSRTVVVGSSSNNSLLLQDPICSSDYCNNRGSCYIVDKYLVCDCKNYYGSNCQIDSFSFSLLKNSYSETYSQLFQSQTRDFSLNILKGLGNLIEGASYFSDDENFMSNILEYISNAQKSYESTLFSYSDDYLSIYNNLIEWGIYRINLYKISNSLKTNPIIGNNVSTSIFRNNTLSYTQETFMGEYFNSLKDSVETLLQFYGSKIKSPDKFIRYISKNVNIYATLMNNQFSYVDYFSSEKKSYEMYFEAQDCLNNAMVTKYGKSGYTMTMTFVNWKVTPFIYSNQLYVNNSSPLVGLTYYDYDTSRTVYISDCGIGYPIQLYFPVTHQYMPSRINEKRNLVDPNEQYDLSSTMFSDPFYIDALGNVFNQSTTERIATYFLPFNFSCHYFNQDNSTYDTQGCLYSNYTDTNYIVCQCSHLTDFVVNFYDVIAHFTVNSRFFYLKHVMLLANWGNYPTNPAFYLILGCLGFYFAVIIIYSIWDCYIYKKLNLLDYLKKAIIKINLPYLRSYEFNNDINLPSEIRQRLNLYPKKNATEDKQIGIKDFDVMVLGDNLGKLKGHSQFLKDTENKDSAQFFQNQNNLNDNQDDDSEKPKQKFFGMSRDSGNGSDEQLNDSEEENKKEKKMKKSKFFKDENEDDSNEENEEEDEEQKDQEEEDQKEDDNVNENEKEKEKDEEKEEDIQEDNRKKKVPRKKIADEWKKKEKEKGAFIFPVGAGPGNFPQSGAHETKENEESIDLDDLNRNDNSEQNEDQKKSGGFFEFGPIQKNTKNVVGTSKFFNTGITKGPIAPKPMKEKLIDDHTNFEFDDQQMNNFLRGGDREPEIIIKKPQVTVIGSEDKEVKLMEYPRVAKIYTVEARLLEFAAIDLSFCEFFCRNLRSRHLVLSSLTTISVVYGSYKRIGNFVSTICLMMTILSILMTIDETIILERLELIPALKFIGYCSVASVGASLLMHPLGLLMYINMKIFRNLYWVVLRDQGLAVLKNWHKISKNSWCRNFWGIVIHWTIFLSSFYISFGFCAVYTVQAKTFFFGLIVAMLLDFLLYEILWELFIAMLYSCKKKSRTRLRLAEWFNKVRTIRTLS